MLAWPPSTARASPPTTENRAASTVHITRRRSHRSSSAPLSSPNSSQGSHSAKLTTETSSGSRVRVAASSGRAVPYTPSPTLDTPWAAHNLANPLPPATLMSGRVAAPDRRGERLSTPPHRLDGPAPDPGDVPAAGGSGKMGRHCLD
jgi:hypothetical protein